MAETRDWRRQPRSGDVVILTVGLTRADDVDGTVASALERACRANG